MKGKYKILLISSIAVVAVVVTFFVCAIASVNSFGKTDTIMANTYFYDVDLGGKTIKEAENLIKNAENLPYAKAMTAGYDEKQFSYTPAGAGIEYDVEKIVNNAYSKGRSQSLFRSYFEILNKNKAKKEEPIYKINEEVFESTIKNLSEFSGIAFENYTYQVFENYCDVKIGKDRKEIDFKKLLSDTMDIIEKEEDRNVSLVIADAKPLTADDIYKNIYSAPQDARTVTEEGKTILVPHVVGIYPEKEDIVKGLEEGTLNIRVKVKKEYPAIRTENLNNQLFKDVLGTYKTNYNKNVIGRSSNVALAASKVNGTILNPGEVFSYNGVVGPRTAAAGFANATVYTSNGSEDGIGGGICQVSSTLYNTALYADMKIVERRNHSYTVSYVKKGLDATVSYGAIDFRFENNKSAPVKITAVAANGVLTVNILGIKENNYKIELQSSVVEIYPYETKETLSDTLNPGEQKVKQNGADGCKAVATKVVKDAAGKVIRSESLGTSVYKPLAKIVEVGPATEMPPVTEENPVSGIIETTEAEIKASEEVVIEEKNEPETPSEAETPDTEEGSLE